MRLGKNWKTVIKKAWSVRFAIILAALEALSWVWPYFNEVVSLAVLTTVQITLAVIIVVARLVQQEDIK